MQKSCEKLLPQTKRPCCVLYPSTLFATSNTFPNVFLSSFAVTSSAILVDFIAVLGHFLGQNGSKMAYKGQKVQKVMVQPIVSFLTIVRALFSRYKVFKSLAIRARVWFDIGFTLNNLFYSLFLERLRSISSLTLSSYLCTLFICSRMLMRVF